MNFLKTVYFSEHKEKQQRKASLQPFLWIKFLKNNSGFTLIEIVIVLVLMGILGAIAHSALRIPKEKIACKSVFSAMQLAKMRSISTGKKAYIDFDMNGGSVSNNFYTVYLDTDGLNSSFGENPNGSGDNEFFESQFGQSDTLGGVPGVALPTGVSFGLPAPNPAAGVFPGGETAFPGDGVSFGGNNAVNFTPKGTASSSGAVYAYDTDNANGICAVTNLATGVIRIWSWNGNSWN